MEKFSKKQRNRLKIMHVAKGLFEKNGIDNVTFDQIADAADVCRTTVFNHFAGTGELMLAITRQEMDDLREYCLSQKFTGKELIYRLYDKLVEDTAYYPQLTAKLSNNAILSMNEENPIREIEAMILRGLRESEAEKGEQPGENETLMEKVLLIEGAYFAIVNHYHINNRPFEADEMREELHRLLSRII